MSEVFCAKLGMLLLSVAVLTVKCAFTPLVFFWRPENALHIVKLEALLLL